MKKKPAVQAKKSYGATRRQGRTPVRWGRWGICLFLLVGFGFASLRLEWHAVQQHIQSLLYRPITQVIIEGEFKYLAKDKVQQVLTEKLLGDFVKVDLNAVKQAIESHPWVADASLRRQWPDTIKVSITEHTPIARWNSDGYINRQGELIKVDSNDMLQKLPVFVGDESQRYELAKNYLFLARLLPNSDLQVAGLQVDDTLAWVVDIKDGFRLVLGQGKLQEKLENFILVYQQHLRAKKDHIVRIDMRYEKGLAVQWRAGDQVAGYQPL